MEFRKEKKERNQFNKKSKDLALFRDRGIWRVDYQYTQHVIKSGNNYQRQQDMRKQGEPPVLDSQATSTVGLVGHLNKKLTEMVAKAKEGEK